MHVKSVVTAAQSDRLKKRFGITPSVGTTRTSPCPMNVTEDFLNWCIDRINFPTYTPGEEVTPGTIAFTQGAMYIIEMIAQAREQQNGSIQSA